jgi:hypothetical protein
MAIDYQSLLDMLKPKEEEPMMSVDSQAPMSVNRDMEMTPPAQPEPQAPMIPNDVPQEQVFTTPKLADILPANKQSQVPMLAEADTNDLAPEKPLSTQEQLLADYKKLLGTAEEDTKALQEARRSDRMLKVGGAIGDALATYINAQGQKRVKAPGVQVQQGAGLGKVADMFATAPEIASDVKGRREELLKKYAELARGERSTADRVLQERKVAAYEAQTKAQAKKAEADATKAAKKETESPKEKPTVGEQTVDREFAKDYNEWRTGGKSNFQEAKKIFEESINALETGKVSTGTVAGVGARIPGYRSKTNELETRTRKAVNDMLRATLGAQFTEKEGERVFKQTFDPSASPEANIANMQTELDKITKRAQMIEAQGKYFTQNKTLSGFPAENTISQKYQIGTILKSDGKRYRVIDEQGNVEEVK